MKISRCNSHGHIFWFRCRCGAEDFIVRPLSYFVTCIWCGTVFARCDLGDFAKDVPWEKGSIQYAIPLEKMIVP